VAVEVVFETHSTTFGLEHLFTGRPREAAVTAPFDWQEGWEYLLTSR
jgi:hypothetical protein